MNITDKIQFLIDSLDLLPDCGNCGIRFSTGDYECPHCGKDNFDKLYEWAATVISNLDN
jgi:hypothetical protein